MQRLTTLARSLLLLGALLLSSCEEAFVEPASALEPVVLTEELVEAEILRELLNSGKRFRLFSLKPTRWQVEFSGMGPRPSEAEALARGVQLLEHQLGMDPVTAKEVCLALRNPEQIPSPVLENRSKADAASTVDFNGTMEFSNSWIRIDGEEVTAIIAVYGTMEGSWDYHLYYLELVDGQWSSRIIDGWIVCG